MRLKIEDNFLFLDNVIFKEVEENYVNNICDEMIEFKGTNFFDIKKFKGEDILENLLFYGFSEDLHYEIFRNSSGVMIKLDKVISLLDWNENISPKEYRKLFNQNSIGLEALNDDESVVLEIVFSISKKDLIGEFFDIFENDIDIVNNEILNKNKIENHINFSPEHLTAGSSILQYFGKFLQEKYPNEKVSVSIKQEGLKVTMTVKTPDGKKEEIEEYLNKYGLVISNQITLQEFTSNPIQVLELETKLESAKMEIGFQKKLLALKDKTYDENLISLKDEVKFLRNELSSIQTSNNEQIKLLLSSLLIKDKLIKKLTKSIDKKDSLETKQLLLELKDKDNNGYIGLKQHLDNAMIGSIVNAPSWIQFTMGIITKL